MFLRQCIFYNFFMDYLSLLFCECSRQVIFVQDRRNGRALGIEIVSMTKLVDANSKKSQGALNLSTAQSRKMGKR